MPEITDQELATAQRLAQLFDSLQKNPQAREHLEDSIKVLNPSMRTSREVIAEQSKPLQDKIEALESRLRERDEREEADRKAREERDARQRLDDGFSRLRKQGLTEEGEEKVKALMTERTIPDPEAAFALFQRQNPPPPPEASSYRPDGWNLETDAVADTKMLFTDPDRWEDMAIAQALKDERNGGED